MSLTSENFLHAAKALLPQLRAWREHIHRHPELSFEEHQTTAYVGEQLEAMDIPFTILPEGVGLVARLENGVGPTTAFRAELDALPIEENTGAEYASTHKGRMHACGHDVHSACLLGALRLLADHKQDWKGTVLGIFQPGEEVLPGGALRVLASGLLNPRPDAVIALHVMPELQAGKVGFREGPYMASTDELHLTLHGKGGHGAMPHLAIDPVVMQAHVVLALQDVVSRWSNPALPTVLTIGKIQAGTAANVIPSEAYLSGTLRNFDEAWRAELHQRIPKLIQSIAEGFGGSAEVEIRKGYPALHNAPELTESLREKAQELLGDEAVHALDIRPTADDFAYYGLHYPACLFRLGTREESLGLIHSVHSPQFDIPREVLPLGAAMLAWGVMGG